MGGLKKTERGGLRKGKTQKNQRSYIREQGIKGVTNTGEKKQELESVKSQKTVTRRKRKFG